MRISRVVSKYPPSIVGPNTEGGVPGVGSERWKEDVRDASEGKRG